MLLLDNFSSHKTQLVRDCISSLKIPTLFSAPASFLAIPVEGVFCNIKALDFSDLPDPEPQVFGGKLIKKYTHKQKMILKVSTHLLNLG